MLSIGNINRWCIVRSDNGKRDLVNSRILFQLSNEGETAFIDMFTYFFTGIWTGSICIHPPFTDLFYGQFNPSEERWGTRH